MSRGFARAMLVGVAGAVVGALCCAGLYISRPSLVITFDRDLPPFTSGFYPPERAGDAAFAWTGERAVLRMAGADRRDPWVCTVRARGARDGSLPQPTVVLSVDTSAGVSTTVTNAFTDIRLEIPARSDRSGLTLTIASTPTFVPGPGDPRQLGVQIDRIECAPQSLWLLPPTNALVQATVATAALVLALAVSGLSTSAVLAMAGLIGVAHGLLLVTSGGTFGAYPDRLGAVAIVVALALTAVVHAPRVLRRAPLGGAGRAAVVLAMVTMHLQLAALAHPGKPVVDGVFQAHRLEWVMAGRYFFTQPLPDGVAFPYAIGLYVFAAPWTALSADHVFVLRAMVMAAHSLAALLLYPLVVRWWQDQRAALLAVVLAHVVPLTFVVIGNANWPNVFAQSVALIALVVATGIGADRSLLGARVAAVALLTALALLSHVSTLVLLLCILAAVAVVAAAFGGTDGRRGAVRLAVAATIAVALALGLYYRHFPEVFERFATRVTASSGAPAADEGAGVSVGTSTPPAADWPAVLLRRLAWHERALGALRQVADDLGWPIVLAAGVGAVLLGRARPRDPLSLVLLGWGAAWVVLLVAGTLTRVDVAYQRYAAEFIGRVNLAGYPVAVLLAARAVSWMWRPAASRAVLIAGAAGLAWAIAIGVGRWSAWFH